MGRKFSSFFFWFQLKQWWTISICRIRFWNLNSVIEEWNQNYPSSKIRYHRHHHPIFSIVESGILDLNLSVHYTHTHTHTHILNPLIRRTIQERSRITRENRNERKKTKWNFFMAFVAQLDLRFWWIFFPFVLVRSQFFSFFFFWRREKFSFPIGMDH